MVFFVSEDQQKYAFHSGLLPLGLDQAPKHENVPGHKRLRRDPVGYYVVTASVGSPRGNPRTLPERSPVFGKHFW